MSIFVDHVALKHSLKKLKDVKISSPADMDFLVYEASSALWKNKQTTLTPQFDRLGLGIAPTAARPFYLQKSGSLTAYIKQVAPVVNDDNISVSVERVSVNQQHGFRFNTGGVNEWMFGVDRASIRDLFYYSYGTGGYVMQLQYDVGSIGFGGAPAISDGRGIHLFGKILRLGTSKTPASASAVGYVGEICWDANYIYVCVAANTWKRAALSTW